MSPAIEALVADLIARKWRDTETAIKQTALAVTKEAVREERREATIRATRVAVTWKVNDLAITAIANAIDRPIRGGADERPEVCWRCRQPMTRQEEKDFDGATWWACKPCQLFRRVRGGADAESE